MAFLSLQVTGEESLCFVFLWLPRWPFPALKLQDVSLLTVVLRTSYGCPGCLSQPLSYQKYRYYGGTEMNLSPPHTILISQTIHVAAASDTIPADDIIAAVTTSAADTMAATNTN